MGPHEHIPAIDPDAVSGKFGIEPTRVTLVAGEDVPQTRASRDSTNLVSAPQAETVAFAQYGSFFGYEPGHLSACEVVPAQDAGIAYVEGSGGEGGVRCRDNCWVCMLACF